MRCECRCSLQRFQVSLGQRGGLSGAPGFQGSWRCLLHLEHAGCADLVPCSQGGGYWEWVVGVLAGPLNRTFHSAGCTRRPQCRMWLCFPRRAWPTSGLSSATLPTADSGSSSWSDRSLGLQRPSVPPPPSLRTWAQGPARLPEEALPGYSKGSAGICQAAFLVLL